ncbi:unnamed protein product [Pneumocystis jirovecii]|uniref:Protein kinase domain-containing protein n=1 Tax=Pneumocystis jirovecii TaxID=42068 RepID=L0PCL8_PNEJI|nr:unnamed protein product [Pneumocystis jirovecii]
MQNQAEKMTEVLSNKFEILSNIGNGSFGNVVLARLKNSNCSERSLVAIKTMKKTFQTVSDCLKLREIQSLYKLPPHPHIISIYNSFLDPTTKRLHMVMEHMEGNLYQLIKSRNKKVFNVQTIQNILYQVLSAIKHIHDHNFFHRDIKPENILVSSVSNQKLSELPNLNNKFQTHSEDVTYIIKLADFGLAREITSQPPYTSYVSTRWYRAPEVLLRANEYSAPVDIWAFGAMAVELATFRPLFPGTNEIDQIWRICEIMGSPATWIHTDKNIEIGGGEWKKGLKLAEKLGFSFPKIPPISLETILSDSWPSSFASFIRWTMQWDPLRRPSCIQGLEHQFFHKINNSPEIQIIESTNCISTSSQSLQKKLNTELKNFQDNKIKIDTNKALFINEKHLDICSQLQKRLSFSLRHFLFRKKYKTTLESKRLKLKDISNDNFLELKTNSWKLRSKNRCYCSICKNRTLNLEALKESIVPKKNNQTSTEILRKPSLYQGNTISIKPLIANKRQLENANIQMGYPLLNSIMLNTENSIVNYPKKKEYDMGVSLDLHKKEKQLKKPDLNTLYSFKTNNRHINNPPNILAFRTFQTSDQSLKAFSIKSNKKNTEEAVQTAYNSIISAKKFYANISQNNPSCSINQHKLINGLTSFETENSKLLNVLNHDTSYEHNINESKHVKNTLCSTCIARRVKGIDARVEKNKNHCYNYCPYEYDIESEKKKKQFLTDSKNKLLLKHISRPFNISKLYSNLNIMNQKSACTIQTKYFNKEKKTTSRIPSSI